MISVTISADQIRGAPAEVRKWIESEVTVALGLRSQSGSAQQDGQELAICSAEEAGSILSLIQGVVPAVNVFFELGHQGISYGQGELEVATGSWPKARGRPRLPGMIISKHSAMISRRPRPVRAM